MDYDRSLWVQHRWDAFLDKRPVQDPHGTNRRGSRPAFNEGQILNKAQDFYQKKKEKRGRHRHFGREFGRVPPPQRRIENKLDKLLRREGDGNEDIKTIDFLLSKENYNDLLSSVGNRIGRGFKQPPGPGGFGGPGGPGDHRGGPGGPGGHRGGPGGHREGPGGPGEHRGGPDMEYNSQVIKGDVDKIEQSNDELKAGSKKKNYIYNSI